MSLIKNPESGNWEADLKDRMAGRLHISMRTRLKGDAMTRYAALRSFVKEGDLELIGRLRDQKIHIEAIERCVRDRVPFATLRGSAERWPLVRDAADQYVEWLESNAKKADRTAIMARTQLKKFATFTREDGTTYGSLRLDAVTTEDIARYQHALATTLNAGSGHAQNTQTAYVIRVGALYTWHREEEERRAMQEHATPRVLHSPIDPRTQPRETTSRERYLSQPEAEALIAATPDQLRFPILLGLYAGLRVSEMLHLQPAPHDIDVVAGVLKVQRKEWRQGKKVRRWKPKTKRSARRVHMNDDLLAVFAHHVARYASREWLFPSPTDPTQPLRESTFGPKVSRIIADAGLEPGRATPQSVSYHTLRHTFASWLVMADENIMTVAKLLGNTVQMVEDTYGHLAPEHRKKAVGRLNGMVPIPPVLDPDTGEN